MRATFFAAAALALLAGSSVAQAGCLTGAAVGGVAGHMVHHGVMGAAAGCAVGHHSAAVSQRQAATPTPGSTTH